MRSYCLYVAGDYACFTRPEMKVERVSYDVMTPSAARGIFEAILWKPAIRWIIEKIEVLEPIRWVSIRRNELGSKAIFNKNDYFIEDDRQQRAGLFLRDVKYRIHAHMEMKSEAGEGNNPGKFMAMFERYVEKGMCAWQPYLGCREFSADFEWIPDPSISPPPISDSRDLGIMLYDITFDGKKDGTISFKSRADDEWVLIQGDARQQWFRAFLSHGVMTVPLPESREVMG